MSTLRQLGNDAYKSGDIKGAIELYTKALTNPPRGELQTTQQKRLLLANRAQAYLKWDDIYDALEDCNRALSPEYTTETSDKIMTAKLHFRRAKCLYRFTRYQEALEDYNIYEQLRDNTRLPPPSELALKDEIENAMRASERPGREKKKVRLIRAVQDRGIILQNRYRSNFPYHPRIREEGQEVTCLVHLHQGRPPSLAVLVAIRTPFLQNAPNDPSLFRGVCPFMEDMKIGDQIESMLNSFVFSSGAGGGDRQWVRKVLSHTNEETSKILMMTQKGRLLVIPRTTFVRDLWAGAKWPREGPLPFEDLRKTPRSRPHEIDGATLMEGHVVELYVVPDVKLNQFVNQIDDMMRMTGM